MGSGGFCHSEIPGAALGIRSRGSLRDGPSGVLDICGRTAGSPSCCSLGRNTEASHLQLCPRMAEERRQGGSDEEKQCWDIGVPTLAVENSRRWVCSRGAARPCHRCQGLTRERGLLWATLSRPAELPATVFKVWVTSNLENSL